MQTVTRFRQNFFKHMLFGLQLASLSSKSMSFQRRKNAIKLSADAAMALARGSTKWSHALITDLSKKEQNQALLRSILGKKYESLSKTSYKIQRSKKILRRSYRLYNARKRNCLHASNALPSSVVARNVVKRKTQVLKKLIPGGESLHGSSLLSEAVDYVVFLKAQVDLMQCLLKATAVSNCREASFG